VNDVIGKRRLTMTHGNGKSKLELIAKAFCAISKEVSYVGLARALLAAALEYSEAVRGAVLLSEEGPLLAKADASFYRERAKVLVTHPPVSEFRLPEDVSEKVLTLQEPFRHDSYKGTALVGSKESSSGGDITILCLPLVHQSQTIGVLYLESTCGRHAFAPECIAMMSMLAWQTAASFETAQLFEALRETNRWMVKGQEIGRMGSYRWNTRTFSSRASRECYRIFDIDVQINPVPFEVFRARIHSEDLPAFERALAEAVSTKSPFHHEYRVVHKDGTILHVAAVAQFDLSPSGDVELEGIITDVTEQKAAEQALIDARTELARTVHLASFGELAGSIVHEVNQPLTGVVMSAEACMRWLEHHPADIERARSSAMRVIELARRASHVVAGIRHLVRAAPLKCVPVQINDVVDEVLYLSKRDFERGGVTLRTDFDPLASEVQGDRIQLQQVVLNLVRNALDAMDGVNRNARILTASTKSTDDKVFVTIADTGIGINPMGKEHLFDALYTTKSEGLGLGLSISRKIIAAHGGRIWLEKSSSHGTVFVFALPSLRSA
jgi:signal transduction histidine kinase